METPTIPVVLYAESTPNPATMKFVANRMLIDDGATAQYLSADQTAGSPLAQKLFRFPFVKGVFVSANYVTVTKTDTLTWDDITLELREFIRDHAVATYELSVKPVSFYFKVEHTTIIK